MSLIPNPRLDKAYRLLKELEYNPAKCSMMEEDGNEKVIELQILSSPIIINYETDIIKDLLPDCKVYNLKNTQTIYIE